MNHGGDEFDRARVATPPPHGGVGSPGVPALDFENMPGEEYGYMDDEAEVQEFVSAERLVNVKQMFGDVISAEQLRVLSGQEDLETVYHIELKINTAENSLSSLGMHLPNLRELKLNNSNIQTTRDLGTALTNVQILWLSRAGVQELEGIQALSQLSELYVSFNDISDLSPLAGHESLTVLDLDTNNINEIMQVHYLKDCTKLNSLMLEGNPLADLGQYRRHVHAALPDLETLDDEEYSGDDREAPTEDADGDKGKEEMAAAASDELKLIGDGIKYARIGIDDDFSME
eukprot:GFYU01023531.1.p1 GENE.GFYU01023531.1~~GFYU01023531.1.p1  ORF type:complete len:288 (-),score=59.76 GFYU01023531.1:609-1472(-)